MGGTFSSNDKVEPSELSNIRSFSQRSNSEISEEFKCKNRSTTDICFLLFFTTCLTVLLCFLGYCIFHGDIFRVINGYDNCGNVCGRSHNALIHAQKTQNDCYEADQRSKPFHIVLRKNVSTVDRFCVSDCTAYEGYRQFFNRCIQNRTENIANILLSKTGLSNSFSEVAEDLQYCWKEIGYLCLISLVLSILILILFRYLVGLVVWVVLIGAVVASSVGSVLLWILWNNSKNDKNTSDPDVLSLNPRKTETYLAFAILATIVTVVVILIIFVMRKRIKLVVQLFEESGKAIAAMPVLLFEPILTFVILGIVVSLWFYFSLWIESSGILTEVRSHVYKYEKDGWMKFTRYYNFFAMLWMTQFVIGCQHMVIAGAVSAWYFTRNKSKLNSPVMHSAYNLSRYHLGSVALGSFIIAIVLFVRIILIVIDNYLKKKQGRCVDYALKCCHCCLYCLDEVLRYLSRNAYIEVAIHGHSFYKAGKQAFKLLSSNALRVAAINSVGDFVLFLGKVIVVVATVLIGVQMLQNKEGVQHMWVPLTLAGLFAYFVVHCFMTVYEMAIDTIFLCFCEDCEKNDGDSKPYYMSRDLMEFVENSKKALEVHDSRK